MDCLDELNKGVKAPDKFSLTNATLVPSALFKGFFLHDLASLLFTFLLNPDRISGGLLGAFLLVC